MASRSTNLKSTLESDQPLDLSNNTGYSSRAVAGPSHGYKMATIKNNKRRSSGCSEWSKIKRKLKTPTYIIVLDEDEQPLDLSMKAMNSNNSNNNNDRRQTYIRMSEADGRNSDDMVDDHFKRVLGVHDYNKIFKPDEKEEAEKLVIEHFMKSLNRPVTFSL